MEPGALTSALRRLLSEESGQDVIEYALLTAMIGVAAVLVWQALASKVGLAYSTADTQIQLLAPPPDPQ